MAGAAQVIGWILTIDDTDLNSKLAGIQTSVSRVQDVLGGIVSEAIKPAVAILEDIRDLGKEMSTALSEMLDPNTWKKISKEVSAIKTDVGEMTDAVKETVEEAEGAEILTKPWVESVKDLFKKISWGVIKGIVLFIPKTIKFLWEKGVKILAIAKDLAILGFIAGVALKKAVGAITSIVTFVPKLIASIGKTVIGSVAKVSKSVFGLLRKGISSLADFANKAMTTALGPVWMIAKFLTEGLKKALGPVFAIVNEFLGVIMFMLKPLFMAFRIMLIPFVLLLMPLLVAGVIFLVKKMVEGWKWLWNNGLEDVWLYISSGKGIRGWWANFKQGWSDAYELTGMKAVWEYISSGKGISGWWANFKKGWSDAYELSGMKALWEYISSGKGISGWWANFKQGWTDAYELSGMKALWEWISNGKGISGWWENMQKGWDTLWNGGVLKVYEWFTDPKAWSKWWDQMKAGWKILWDGIVGGIESVMNWIRWAIGGIVKLVGIGIRKSGEVSGWVSSTIAGKMINIGGDLEFFGMNLQKPAKLAEGAVISGPTIALLGEAGTEIVVPLMRGAGAGAIETTGATGVVSPLPAGFSVENLMKTLAEIRDFLSRIVDNTEDQSWINDSDFNAQRDRGPWEA